MDGSNVTVSGGILQILAAATGKARLSKVDSLKDGTTIG